MSPKIADRMNQLSHEAAFHTLAQAQELERKGRKIIHLEIGDPDFDSPASAKEAAIEALENNQTHYSVSQGMLELRELVAADVSGLRNIPVTPEEVVIVPGCKPTIFYGIVGCVEHGDEVLLPDPGFPAFESVTRFAGGKPVYYNIVEDNGRFALDLEQLEWSVSERTKMIILNFPHNPTGMVVSIEELEAIAELALKHDLWVLTDEVYSRLVYDGEFRSIASLPGMKERTIILDGFSKTYAMTGWRLGYGVMPKHLAEKTTLLVVNSVSCTSTITQLAGAEALRSGHMEVQSMATELKRRRDYLHRELNRLPGISCIRSQGAFYLFPNVTEITPNSRELASYLLHEVGVATLQGTAFGPGGEGYLRVAYVNSMENLIEAVRLLRIGLERFMGSTQARVACS